MPDKIQTMIPNWCALTYSSIWVPLQAYDSSSLHMDIWYLGRHTIGDRRMEYIRLRVHQPLLI